MSNHLCTHAYHDDLFLTIWLKYHSVADPTLNLHVILTEEHEGEADDYRSRFPNVDFVVWSPTTRGDDTAMVVQVEELQRRLFTTGAKVVGHLDADEYVIPTNSESLCEWMQRFANDESRTVCRATGWQVFHKPDIEPPAFQTSSDILEGRNHAYESTGYSKPCFVKQPTTWALGFHKRCVDANQRRSRINDPIDPTLELLHLSFFDLQFVVDRHAWVNSDRSKLSDSWHYARNVAEASFRKFLNDLVPPWEPGHYDFMMMRKTGSKPVKEHWRGKLLK